MMKPQSMDRYNWTDQELSYLVVLTGTDCVRLKGSSEPRLRKLAQKTHAKLRRVSIDRQHWAVRND